MEIYWRKEWTRPAVGGAGLFLVGAGLGWIAREVKFKRDFTLTEVEETVEIEVVEDDLDLRAEFDNINSKLMRLINGKNLQPVSVPRVDYVEAAKADTDPQLDPVVEDASYTNWDQEAEEEDRGPTSPYTIHRDEYFNSDTGYGQADLTYYTEDDILCDDKNIPVYNVSATTGSLQFGHGSGQENVVYIRNPKLEMEFEVTRVHSTYAEAVLGQEVEEQADAEDLKHSQRLTKFR